MAYQARKVFDDESFVKAFQIAQSSILSATINTAIELNIFNVMASTAGHQLSTKDIAARLQSTHNVEAPMMLDRMLRLLASHSVVSCSLKKQVDGNIERLYGLNSISKFFIEENDGSLASLVPIIEGNVLRASWSKLKDAVLQGGTPFNLVHGVHIFEYPRIDPLYNDAFNKAMFSCTTVTMEMILERYQGFKDILQLVDVGGGLGHTLHMIIPKYPSIRGINFDLPHVICDAVPYAGVEHVAGDMFESVPKGDVIFMKWILHDWKDNDTIKLLKNCYEALPDTRKVIVVDAILTENPETTTLGQSLSQMDVYMMVQTPGGRERTEKEFLNLALAAGFRGINLSCSIALVGVMEFYK